MDLTKIYGNKLIGNLQETAQVLVLQSTEDTVTFSLGMYDVHKTNSNCRRFFTRKFNQLIGLKWTTINTYNGHNIIDKDFYGTNEILTKYKTKHMNFNCNKNVRYFTIFQQIVSRDFFLYVIKRKPKTFQQNFLWEVYHK